MINDYAVVDETFHCVKRTHIEDIDVTSHAIESAELHEIDDLREINPEYICEWRGCKWIADGESAIKDCSAWSIPSHLFFCIDK